MGLRQSIFVTTQDASFGAILGALETTGWRIEDHQGVTFLPLDATDESEWELWSEASIEEVRDACRRRDERGEVPGLVMMFQDSGIGSRFIWLEGQVLVGSLEIGPPDPFDLTLSASVVSALIEAGVEMRELEIKTSAD